MIGAQTSAEIQARVINGEQDTLPRAMTGAQKSAEIKPKDYWRRRHTLLER